MTEVDFHKALLHVMSLLTAAITNTRFYDPTHPQVGRYVEKAYQGLTQLLAKRQEITLFLVGDDVVADNRQLASDSPHVTKLVDILKKNAVERMTFVSGLLEKELAKLIQDMASTDTASVRSSRCIRLGKVEIGVESSEEVEASGEIELEGLLEAKGMELDEVKDLYLRLKRQEKSEFRGVDDIVKEFIKGFRRDIELMNALAALKSTQEHTFTHAVNVGMLTMSQAETMGFEGEQLHDIGVAAMLHDIGKLFLPEELVDRFGEHLDQIDVALMLRDVGKLFIPDSMVDKVRKLTREDRSAIEAHTIKGALHLMGLDGIPKLAALAAMEHHIRYDGSGYPVIKGGRRPNLVSQMIAISDMFDAMPSKDASGKTKPLDKIVWVLNKGKGTSFNPQVVDHFLKLIKK
ncbi:MAG: HD domain-containing protein [Thermodesulfobacteriota bacterium]|nr:HD domain-containing protein [Thermodesulfobacteriota bacterium]